MTLPYNPDSIPYGSRVLTINSIGFVADNFSVDEPTSLLERQDELGAPNGVVAIENARTGNAKLQISSTSVVTFPQRGDEFSTEVDGTVTTFFITSKARPEEGRSIKSIDINFRESV